MNKKYAKQIEYKTNNYLVYIPYCLETTVFVQLVLHQLPHKSMSDLVSLVLQLLNYEYILVFQLKMVELKITGEKKNVLV